MFSYVRLNIGINRFESESITYDGTNGTSKRWRRHEAFGGKPPENII